jgi:hypothetical protein
MVSSGAAAARLPRALGREEKEEEEVYQAQFALAHKLTARVFGSSHHLA